MCVCVCEVVRSTSTVETYFHVSIFQFLNFIYIYAGVLFCFICWQLIFKQNLGFKKCFVRI